MQEGENVVFHREHRSKKNRKFKLPPSNRFKEWKFKKKYGDIHKNTDFLLNID